MSLFDNLFSGGQQQAASDMGKGYQMSMQEYQQALDQIKQLMGPYMQQGQQAANSQMNMSDQMRDQFMHMMGNPSSGGWMGTYQQSPYAKYLTQMGTQSANNAASASGMIGSNANLRNVDTMSQQISSEDMQRYYQNMMGMEQGAMGGYQPIADRGFQGAGMLSGEYNNYANQMSNAYQNQGMANAYGDTAYASGINNFLNAAPGMFKSGEGIAKDAIALFQ